MEGLHKMHWELREVFGFAWGVGECQIRETEKFVRDGVLKAQ